MQRHFGYLCILAAATLWGLMGPLSVFCQQQGISPLEMAFWRTCMGGTAMCAHALGTRGFKVESGLDGLVFFCFGAVSLGFFFSCYQFSVGEGGAALAAVLLYTAPAWVAFMSRLLFRETLTRGKLSAIGLSLAGVGFISFSGAGGETAFSVKAVAFGLAAGALYSTHYIVARFYLRRYSPFTLYGLAMLSGALVLFPFVDFAPRTPPVWCALAAVGLGCTYLAYWVYCEGIKRVAPTRAAVLATFEPVVATAVAWVWWGESFSAGGWLGAGLILGAVLVIIRDEKARV